MSEDTVSVRLLTGWRGKRYGDVVDMPDDVHTWAWVGMGLCQVMDDWLPERGDDDDDVLYETAANEPGQPAADGPTE